MYQWIKSPCLKLIASSPTWLAEVWSGRLKLRFRGIRNKILLHVSGKFHQITWVMERQLSWNCIFLWKYTRPKRKIFNNSNGFGYISIHNVLLIPLREELRCWLGALCDVSLIFRRTEELVITFDKVNSHRTISVSWKYISREIGHSNLINK